LPVDVKPVEQEGTGRQFGVGVGIPDELGFQNIFKSDFVAKFSAVAPATWYFIVTTPCGSIKTADGTQITKQAIQVFKL
jgi:hypothetical protein